MLQRGSSVACAVLVVALLPLVLCGPVPRQPPPPTPVEADAPEDEKHTGLAYDSYLRQVVEVLESDPEFRKKLETANVSDIKSGKIAMYLEMVNHTVRSSLDELKRREIARLQNLVRMQMQDVNGRAKDLQMPQHLDVRNPRRFDQKDLEKLIKQTTTDLEEMDRQRQEKFKEYEIEKEYEKRQHLRELPEEKRREEEERLNKLKQKHADHPKINHPGSKDQFEEVWEKQDGFEDQEFNPKTFFFKHDLNGDMYWSIEEVDVVLQGELDKVYDARNAPEEDDPREREEEMDRMRLHIFKEMDKNEDKQISFDEFIQYTGQQGDNPEFKQDDGWKTVDEEPVFNDEDYDNYVKEHHPNAQPGVIQPPASNDLRFQGEHQGQAPLDQHIQQQQQAFQQQQQQFQQQQQQQQFQQQQQQQFQQQQQQQEQFQQHPPQFQQQPGVNVQHNVNQQPHPAVAGNPANPALAGNPPPAPPQGGPANVQHNVVNMNQGDPSEQERLKQQLKELQEKLNQQQQAKP